MHSNPPNSNQLFDNQQIISPAGPPSVTQQLSENVILAGTLNMKMAQPTLRLYEQMPEPKYVIAMGACMITGGMFSADSYTAIRGADKILPIDVYIPGCPPRPEAIMDGIIKLRKKISNQSIQERGRIRQTHRYYSTTHNMKLVPPTAVTGKDATLPSRQQPPKELAEAMGMPIPPALKAAQNQEVSNE